MAIGSRQVKILKNPIDDLAIGSRQVNIQKAQLMCIQPLCRLNFFGGGTMNLNKELRFLNDRFYKETKEFSEILHKPQRPYAIALFEIDHLQFAIPFRTNISHPYAYKFKNFTSKKNSGLDFSKAVIIEKDKLGNQAFIDNQEYLEFSKRRAIIAKRFFKFLENYKKWIENPTTYQYKVKSLKYCTLQYYHQKLGIKAPQE